MSMVHGLLAILPGFRHLHPLDEITGAAGECLLVPSR